MEMEIKGDRTSGEAERRPRPSRRPNDGHRATGTLNKLVPLSDLKWERTPNRSAIGEIASERTALKNRNQSALHHGAPDPII